MCPGICCCCCCCCLTCSHWIAPHGCKSAAPRIPQQAAFAAVAEPCQPTRTNQCSARHLWQCVRAGRPLRMWPPSQHSPPTPLRGSLAWRTPHPPLRLLLWLRSTARHGPCCTRARGQCSQRLSQGLLCLTHSACTGCLGAEVDVLRAYSQLLMAAARQIPRQCMQELGSGVDPELPPFAAVKAAVMAGEPAQHEAASPQQLVAWRQAFRSRLGHVQRLEQVLSDDAVSRYKAFCWGGGKRSRHLAPGLLQQAVPRAAPGAAACRAGNDVAGIR